MKKHLNLLIVDDDADDRQFFIDALGEIDETIECTMAKDGFTALEILNDQARVLPDFIFLDLRMPRYDGRRCLAEIKANHHLESIPVIIYSTSTETKDAIDLKERGAAHFISKPYSIEELNHVLTMVLHEQILLKEK